MAETAPAQPFAPDARDVLVRQIGSGSPSAEAEFVRIYGAGVRALVRRHARPADPAVEDLTQDILRNLIESLRRGDIRDAQALPAYVRNAVVFSVRAEYRRRQRRGENRPAESVDTLVDPDDPARRAQREQLGAVVRRLLAELPVDRDREVLRRFYIDEHEAAEICTSLGIELDHFRRVTHRARERLRALLRDAGITEAP